MRSWYVCTGLLAACWAGAVLAGAEPVVVWDQASRVDVGLGYHDNVLRTSIAPEGSGYVRTSADASLMRLSSSDRLLVLFLLAEDTRYFEGPVGYEQFASLTGRFSSPVGGHDEAGLELGYLYQHQIFDASETEANLYRILVKGHGLTARTHWRHNLGSNWSARLDAALLRQIYDANLDDYWEESGRLSLNRAYGHRSEASLGYQLLRRDYDSRNQYDVSGVAQPGTLLVYQQHEVTGDWKHCFDAERRWRSSIRTGYLRSEDTGSGYFDYERFLVRQQLRWKTPAWDIKAAVRCGWYRYAVQQVNGARRERSYAAVSLRAERRLGRHWLAYTAAEHEWNASNDPLDEYRDWMVEGGVGYEF